MAITLGVFDAAQWRDYREVRLRALREAPDAFVTRYDDAVARDDAWWQALLVPNTMRTSRLIHVRLADAEQGAAVVGMVCGTVEAARPDVCEVTQMWTAPEARGLGVGRALLDAVVAWGKQRGASVIELGVVVDNGSAQRLYRGYGFVEFGDVYPLREGSAIVSRSMRLALG